MKGSKGVWVVLFLVVALAVWVASVMINHEQENIRRNRETEQRLNEESIRNNQRRGF